MSLFAIGMIGMAILFVLFALRLPIAFCLFVVGVVGYAYIVNFDAGISLLGRVPFITAASYELSVIPLFTLMGYFFFYSGNSAELYSAMYKWLGKLPGGLAMATIGTSAGFAAVCGSTAATVATVGAVALPEMQKYRYHPSLACGVTAAGGTLGIMIPPSVILVIYGMLTEQSIGKLFMAGILPGVLLALLFMAGVYVQVKRNPDMAPPAPGSTFKEKIVSLKGIWTVLLLFLLVIVGIYTGTFTPTEAASVGAFASLVLALVRKQLSRQGFNDAIMETVKVTGMIFALFISAYILSYFLAVTKIPFQLANYVAGLDLPSQLIMAAIILLLLILGCFINSMSIIVLMVPILHPVVLVLGFDPIWFGVIIVLITEMGLITPPVGGNVFIVAAMAKNVPLYTVFRGVTPFVIAGIIAAVILQAFPQIALFLPGTM